MSRLVFPPGEWQHKDVRVAPLPSVEQTLIQKFLLWLTKRAAKASSNLNVFLVLARLGPIFPRYLLFLSHLLMKGRLSRVDKERVILHLAWRLGCRYEWVHHFHMATDLGLSTREILSMADRDSPLWDDRTRSLVQAADELLDKKVLTDMTWAQLRPHLNGDETVELCMLVGHYVMVAMTINATGIQPEASYLES